MKLEIGIGSVVSALLAAETSPQSVSARVLFAWAHNLQRFTYTQGGSTSYTWQEGGAAGSENVTVSASTTFRAKYNGTEITNPWVWAYLRDRFPESCGFVADNANVEGGSVSSAIYTGGQTGCPTAADFDVIELIGDNSWALTPSLSFDAASEVEALFGYTVTDGRDALENLKVKSVLQELQECESSGAYPPLPEPPDEPTVTAAFQWNSNGQTSFTINESTIDLTKGGSSGLTVEETADYDFGTESWGSFSVSDVIAGVNSGYTETYTRQAFNSWTWNKADFLSTLADLGVTL